MEQIFKNASPLGTCLTKYSIGSVEAIAGVRLQEADNGSGGSSAPVSVRPALRRR